MKTKYFYLSLLLLVLGTANVWADKYYRVPNTNNSARYNAVPSAGQPFFIYNTAYLNEGKLLNNDLDYSPKNFTATEKNDTDRALTGISLTSSKYGDQFVEFTTAQQNMPYINMPTKIFRADPGEEVTAAIAAQASWVHSYAYIDYDADGFTTTIDNVPMRASTIEGAPEYIYSVKSAASGGVYLTGETHPALNGALAGQFAFYAAQDSDGSTIEGAYYIYSVTAGKWLTYDKADSYSDGKNFVKLATEKGNYFKVDNYEGNNYQISPYTNAGNASKYLNWHAGVNQNTGTPLGLYSTGGAGDAGSRFTFTSTTDITSVAPSTTEGAPEFVYYMVSGKGVYVGGDATAADNKYDHGRFAFYAAQDGDGNTIEDTYYIYNVTSGKWLTYTKADSYTGGANFIQQVADKASANYFKITKGWGNCSQIQPYTNSDVSGFYLNFYGNGNTLGIYDEDASSDVGSRFLIYGVDLATFSYYSYNDGAENGGFDSDGTSCSPGGTTYTMPAFKAPAEPGFYRLRYKMDYNSMDPDGDINNTNGTFMGNRGVIVDVILQVVCDADYTGFLYNDGTKLDLTKYKGQDKMIFNECHLFTLEEAGEEYAYYIKSLSTGTYVNIDGSAANEEPQKVYIYTWYDAVAGIEQDTEGDNGAITNNGSIKQTTIYSSENSAYSIVPNSQIDKSEANEHGVFIIASEDKTKYWAGTQSEFRTADEGMPFAFVIPDLVDESDYADIQDLHIYSRCDLYSAQQIYGYVYDGSMYSSNYPATDSEGNWYESIGYDGLIDFDNTTYFHSAWDSDKGDIGETGTHYLQTDLGGKATTAFRFYFKRRLLNNYNRPTEIEIYGSNDLTAENEGFGADPLITINTSSANPLPTADDVLEYTSDKIPCENGGAGYKYLRFLVKSVNAGQYCFAFSEFYVLPARAEVEQSLAYLDSELPIVATAKQYSDIVEEYNSTVPETKLLSGVPLPGNKYYIYADAYNNGTFAEQFVRIADDNSLTTTSTDYRGAAEADKEYYVWVCEETIDGYLTFRNVKTGQYLANGTVQDAVYKWSINTCDTYRHGVPLKSTDNKYLAVQTAISDGAVSWLADVVTPQNQTTGYTYVTTTTVTNDNGTPDDESDDYEEKVEETVVDDTRLVCTDFVFLPVDRDSETEKKITITASSDLAMRNSLLTYNDVEYSLPFTVLLQKLELPTGYSQIVTIMNGKSYYATPATDYTTVASEAGHFALYPVDAVDGVDDVTNAYYIYSISDGLWLTYEQPAEAFTGDGKQAIINLSTTKNSKSFFYIDDISVTIEEVETPFKQLRPYFENFDDTFYLNWHGNNDVALGVYTGAGTADAGSRYTFTEVTAEAAADWQNRIAIEERVGTYHKFVGFYRKDANGDYTEQITADATLNFDDVNDGDYIEARFEIVKPFELSANGTYTFYALQNVTDGRYAAYAGDNVLMTLNDTQSALTLFYFTNGETDADVLKYSHSSGYIEHVITHSKLSDAGKTNVSDKPAKWTVGGQQFYMQPNLATNGNQGYTITNTLLSEDRNLAPVGLCGDNVNGTIGTFQANDPYAVWQFVEVSESDAITYLTQFISDFVISINEKLTEQGESDLYDDNKISKYNERITDLNTEATTAELSRLVAISQELYAINSSIAAATLHYPEISEAVTTDSYSPKWYYLKNVKSETYVAEYVGDEDNMTLYNSAADDAEKKLAHLFYFGGALYNEAGEEINDYSVGAYMKSCIHNFQAHVHNSATNEVVDKTLVSENEELFEDVALQGTGTKSQVILEAANNGVLLENSLPWNVEFEGNSDGSTVNAFGSSLLATGSESLAQNYYYGFQVYLKADGYILVKLGSSEKLDFNHTQDLFSTYKVEIAWRPNDGAQATDNIVAGNLTFTITNSNGEARSVTYDYSMKDVKMLTTAIPAGVNITQMSGEVVNAMKWTENHTESNWYILPSSNTVCPGLAIVTTSASDENDGWSNDGSNAMVEPNTGNLDTSTWQFVRVTDFTDHIDELLSIWTLDNAVVYNEELVNLYKNLMAARIEHGNTETAFNTMVSHIRSHTGLTVDEILNTDPDKFYVLRPTNSNDKYAAVSVFNSLATQENMVSNNEYDSRAVFTFTGTNDAMEMVNLHTQSHVGELGADSVLLDAAAVHEVKLQPIGGCLVRVVSNDVALSTNTSNNMLVGIANDVDAVNHYTSTVFERDDTDVTDYAVPVTNLAASIVDAYGNIAGSVAVASSHDLKTGGDSGNFDAGILSPNINANALNGGSIELTFTYTDLPAGFKSFNNIGLYVHALNGAGSYQESTADRVWSITAQVGPDDANLAEFGKLENIDIIPDVSQSMWNITNNEFTTVTDNKLVVKLVITAPTDNPGCFIGLSNIVLSSEGNTWYIEEVASKTSVYHATTVNSLGLGTLMLGYAATVPEGIEAFYPTAENDLTDKHVTMESYNGVIPAEAPVILDVKDGYANDATYKFYYNDSNPADASGKAAATDGVIIAGSLYEQLVPANKYDTDMGGDCNIYMFVNGQKKPRLYWVYESYDADGTDHGATDLDDGYVMCRANRAFVVFSKDKLATANAASAASLSLRLNKTSLPTTGIDDVECLREIKTNSVVEGIFDLQGRKLNEITEPGVYIVNGNKVVVK